MGNPNNATRERTNLQTIAIEYRTSGRLDGETVAPAISLDPTSPLYVPPDPRDHVHRYPGILAQNIGLIDLSLNGTLGGGMADRYVKGFFASGAFGGAGGMFGLGAQLFVGDTISVQFGLLPIVQYIIEPIAPVGSYYRDICFMIPQGSMLGITGLPVATAMDSYNIVRVQILDPWTVWSAPLLEQACCCEQEERGPPPPGG